MDAMSIGPLGRAPAPRPIGNSGGRRGGRAFDDLLKSASRPTGEEERGRREEAGPGDGKPLQDGGESFRKDDQDGPMHVDVMA